MNKSMGRLDILEFLFNFAGKLRAIIDGFICIRISSSPSPYLEANRVGADVFVMAINDILNL